MADQSAEPDHNERERERLAVLRSYGVMNSAPDRRFDDLVDLAAHVCDTPTALVSLVGEKEQWFKARTGLRAASTDRRSSFCAHAMVGDDIMVISDATRDPRFADNPLVTGEPHIRFYAGAPLVSPEGAPLGSLCVIDSAPRPDGLTEVQARGLRTLARQVMMLLETTRAELFDGPPPSPTQDLATADDASRLRRLHDSEMAQAARHLADSEARFRVLADAMPQMVWSTLPDGFHDYYNARWYEFTGVSAGTTDGEGWNDMFHPEDQERAWSRWRRSLETGEPYEIEYRLRHHSGVYRWTLGRATPIRDAKGRITRWFGTCTDIDDLKRMEQTQSLVSQELSHRIKNIFAVVSALIALSARQYPEAKAFAASFRTRINALARAHEFVRPHTEASRPTVGTMTLHAFLASLFQPYADAARGPRVRLTGDDAVFDDQAATSVALLFHELATNAAKHGALSAADGFVDLETRQAGNRFILTWTEQGGPRVAGPPARSGFGSSLAVLSVEGQLGGRLTRDWRPTGLCVTVDLPGTALSRRRAAMNVA